ncbi:Lrp/AsnC family transcriptional regulator [Paenibacillus cellulositrophicus]|uniref:DNA-binding Lrp family transcriptional regulator n=3 Tax=Paenibacillus TaxID=44249 RepID=A0A839TYT6_9BACL|nr:MULTISPECIES: Lrp/AsnC family transcriptional regulator [Paenibacillus]MBB3131631.1 DNA-binding Lrp family transcriptional regulator [Paenibacillus rhizosphaerae]MBJ9991228.1 Lrp/AsnC family transcriptional regulator [Paenibacillus sp. S28]MCM3001786.1 Lrp/AsnC family transcriptional regulator [Paenibacillus cellulositrophicus]MEC0175794.1 Lrp/AsnC family transcriptional regulator [Paenibacillus favisporus]OXL85361.1 AsnC family transcriptional regulator [Paenibacillus sp. SSG-1]
MKFKHLDEKDNMILDHLLDNGRLSHAELGRFVNLTRAAVRERVNGLMEQGIIDKFTVIVNPLKAGKSMSVYFLIEVEWNLLETVAETLLADDEITSVYQMSGGPHLHVHALMDDQEHVEKYLRKLQTVEGITNVHSEFLIRRFKEREGIQI